jgi:transposase
MCYKARMEKIDARKLKTEAQQLIRNQVIRLRKSGKTYKEISEIVGIQTSTACQLYKAYEKGGRNAIKIKKRGRPKGSCRTLNSEQEKRLRNAIVDNTPDQLKFPFALWTRGAVQQLVSQLFSIKMPIRTVGEYLRRWGFTPQKPLRRAYEQNPKLVEKWLDEQYPAIAAKAKKQGAEIHWGDETGLCSDSQHGRSYAPRGKTPAIRLNAKKERINLISSITNQGKVRFMIYNCTMNSQTFIKFCQRLIKDSDKKVFLILDNLRVHHSHVVKDWVKDNQESIELFFLPSYSPELNPDEYLNCDLKAGVHSGAPARSKSQLKSKALSHLRMLQKMPARVAKYFKHPKIAYAS